MISELANLSTGLQFTLMHKTFLTLNILKLVLSPFLPGGIALGLNLLLFKNKELYYPPLRYNFNEKGALNIQGSLFY